MNLDAGHPAAPLADEPSQEVTVPFVKKMGHAVGKERMHRGIQEENLQITFGGRIPFHNITDILVQGSKHRAPQSIN
jgi:hypothetical protein